MVAIRLDLDPLSLRAGEEVRFRSPGGGHWRIGTVTARERDGRVRVDSADGASRCLPPDHIQVRLRGRRGWEPVLVRAGRAEQLRLL